MEERTPLFSFLDVSIRKASAFCTDFFCWASLETEAALPLPLSCRKEAACGRLS